MNKGKINKAICALSEKISAGNPIANTIIINDKYEYSPDTGLYRDLSYPYNLKKADTAFLGRIKDKK